MAWVDIGWPSNENPTRYDIEDGLIIGRSPECEVILEDDGVSAKHAWIRRKGKQYILIDLRSKNGIKLNGEPILEHPLHDGDTFSLSDVVCRFHNPQEVRKPAEDKQTTKAAAGESDTGPADQCPSCGYLVPGHMRACPRCGQSITGTGVLKGESTLYDMERTRRAVRVMSSLAFAGGVVGPLLLGIGWVLAIVLGVMVLTGYRIEADEHDRKMARRGILLGVFWLLAIVWAALKFWLKIL